MTIKDLIERLEREKEEEEESKRPAPELSPIQQLVGQSPVGRLNRLASNFVPDMVEAVGETREMLEHPGDTARGVATLGRQLVNKGIAEGQELITGQEMPENMPGYETDLINSVGRELEQNFGSPEAALETVTQHPFDTAMMFTGASGMKPIGAAGRMTNKGLKMWRDEAARAGYGIPEATLDKGKDVARYGVESGIMTTRRGLRRLNAIQERLNAEITDQLNLLPDVQYIPTQEVLKKLDELKLKYVDDVDELQAVAIINKKQQELMARYPDGMTPKQVQKQKTTSYKKGYSEASARAVEGRSVPEPSENTYRAVGRGGREALESRLPKLEGINEEWSKVAQLRPYLERRVNAPMKSSDGMIKGAIKAVAPGTAKVLDVVSGEWAKRYGNKLLSYTPQQVRYMVSKVSVDRAAQALWAAGQFDELLEE